MLKLQNITFLVIKSFSKNRFVVTRDGLGCRHCYAPTLPPDVFIDYLPGQNPPELKIH
jgi:hypothetical protein